ncbi:helix-turn-helix domain-containing protein [Mesorhizobium sp. B2-3-15]|uniref:helix-turn-helix domain-containing protein n=1 Tax=Mesorhizobium sp. B2-3-15 TaxID=2589949 RepID=UPI001FEFDB6C|nr:helix-turn-helix domain-containing protein [Mesorhizobium sp. B2-3-15]
MISCRKTGSSFAEHILELRLQRAHRMLRDRRNDRMRVSEIALLSGFSDVSYFNRCSAAASARRRTPPVRANHRLTESMAALTPCFRNSGRKRGTKDKDSKRVGSVVFEPID